MLQLRSFLFEISYMIKEQMEKANLALAAAEDGLLQQFQVIEHNVIKKSICLDKNSRVILC